MSQAAIEDKADSVIASGARRKLSREHDEELYKERNLHEACDELGNPVSFFAGQKSDYIKALDLVEENGGIDSGIRDMMQIICLRQLLRIKRIL